MRGYEGDKECGCWIQWSMTHPTGKVYRIKEKSAVSAPDCRTVPATASVKESKDGRQSPSAPDLGNFCSSVYGLEAHSCTRWSL